MRPSDILTIFLESVPAKYPHHMFCLFAENATKGIILPFLNSLISSLYTVDLACPGYAHTMLKRIGSIRNCGEEQYDALLSILAEIYVTFGLISEADRDGDTIQFNHEPAIGKQKNPEFEVRVHGNWCAVEVKAPRLTQFSNKRFRNKFQLGVRLPDDCQPEGPNTLPRDNPVKDFLISANEKFMAYEEYRSDAIRILVIVWDDFCNEPIAALISPVSGLLTQSSFYRDKDQAVLFPYIDGIVVIRHQHQLIRATRCEPLVDGIVDAFQYHHDGFPPKAFIKCHGGRVLKPELLIALNAISLDKCFGAEYSPLEMTMWIHSDNGK